MKRFVVKRKGNLLRKEYLFCIAKFISLQPGANFCEIMQFSILVHLALFPREGAAGLGPRAREELYRLGLKKAFFLEPSQHTSNLDG